MKKNHLLTHERRSLIAPTDSVTAEAIARRIGLVDRAVYQNILLIKTVPSDR